MYLFLFLTHYMFRAHRAHHLRHKLCQYSLWKWTSDLHTTRPPTQSDSYQRLYWHNLSLLMMSTMWSKHVKGKGKGLPQQAGVAQGVPGRLRPRIFLTFGTTRVVGRQPYAPPPLPQDKSMVLILIGWVNPRAHGSIGTYGKIPSDTTGNRSPDRPTSSAVP